MTQETTQTPPPQAAVERVFDEHGNTVEEVVAPATGGEAGRTEVTETVPKFRIGEREFGTEAEALAFAQSELSTLQTEQQVADAYRQGIRDAVTQPIAPAPSVTPPKPAVDMTKFYENPQEFLDQRDAQVKAAVLQEVRQHSSLQAESDRIWREFTDRHPALADFRSEVEAFVTGEQATVRAIIGTKGRPASYDYIATKLKSDWEKKAAALKPRRELSNNAGGPSPTQRAASITPPAPAKKAETFTEQLNKIRKRGRKA